MLSEKEQVRIAQVSLIYGNSTIGYAVSVFMGGLLCLILFSHVSTYHILSWLFSLLSITGLRFLLTRYFHQADVKTLSLKKWEIAFLLGAGLSGGIWGTSVLFLFPSDSAIHQLILLLFLAGLVGGSVGVYSSLTSAFLSFTLPIAIIVSLKFIVIGDMFSIIIATLTWVYFIGMAVACRHSEQAIRNALELRFDNEKLKHEIAQRKQVEEALQKSEEKYRLAMSASKDGLWDWDILSGTVYYNSSWKRILGLQSIENNLQSWEHRIYEKDKDNVLTSLRDHLSGRSEAWQEEHRLKKDNGQWVWVLSRGQVVKRDSQGNPLRMIGTMADISSQKENEKIIQTQANYDSLTLLPNRKLFHELLDKEIKQANRDRGQIWILFMDLDGFKEINDTFGHRQGDKLLVMVAKRIQSMIRQSDVVARLGGDEFVIILHTINEPSDIDRIATNLIEKISEKYILENNELYVTTSIGIANYPNDAENVDDLLKFADQSMYAAKKEGKNQYTYFRPEFQYASLIRMQIAADIRKAIKNDEFELYYQPIFKLDTKEIHKAEVLIRWNHPEKGLISPGGFIHVAEESSVICDIGLWIFDQVLKQLKSWHAFVGENFQLSINMSPLQLKTKEKKYHFWINALNNPFFSGKNIVLEITEGLLIQNEPNVNKKLLEFRDAGIQVAIDDFGTGYSSLSYLKEFDIDYLKIDQSFIRNLETGSKEESLSEAIVVMAHKLGLEVIAEGIETEKQYEILKSMGCDYGQGYLFSKPLPASEFELKFIKKSAISYHICDS